MAVSNQGLIDEQYQKSLEAQKEKLKADYNVSVADYNAKKDKADETYQPLRDEAYVNNALAEKTRKESMGNMGLSSAGGTSLSLQQRNNSTLLSTLGGADRQQQNYLDEINLALGNLDTKYNADVLSAESENTAQKNAAMLSQSQFDSNLALGQDQLKLSQDDSKFQHYYDLLVKKLITRKQFEKETGYKLR